MTADACLSDLQRRYRLAMACGSLDEMSRLFEQIQRLRLAAMRRRSTQKMAAVTLETAARVLR